MSYGVWRKHGKGWSSIEIDSPWNYYGKPGKPAPEDVWKSSQERMHPFRKIVSYYFYGGEHQTWIAFDSTDALIGAMNKLHVSNEDREQVFKILERRCEREERETRRISYGK